MSSLGGLELILGFFNKSVPDNRYLREDEKKKGNRVHGQLTIRAQGPVTANLYSSAVREPPAGSPTRKGRRPAHNGASNY
jgi:hypothetical protein